MNSDGTCENSQVSGIIDDLSLEVTKVVTYKWVIGQFVTNHICPRRYVTKKER